MDEELIAAYLDCRARLAALDAEPEKHPDALRVAFRRVFEEVEVQVLAYLEGGRQRHE